MDEMMMHLLSILVIGKTLLEFEQILPCKMDSSHFEYLKRRIKRIWTEIPIMLKVQRYGQCVLLYFLPSCAQCMHTGDTGLGLGAAARLAGNLAKQTWSLGLQRIYRAIYLNYVLHGNMDD